jgi:hypothetical protein
MGRTPPPIESYTDARNKYNIQQYNQGVVTEQQRLAKTHSDAGDSFKIAAAKSGTAAGRTPSPYGYTPIAPAPGGTPTPQTVGQQYLYMVQPASTLGQTNAPGYSQAINPNVVPNYSQTSGTIQPATTLQTNPGIDPGSID